MKILLMFSSVSWQHPREQSLDSSINAYKQWGWVAWTTCMKALRILTCSYSMLKHVKSCCHTKKNGAKAQRKSLKLETIKDEPSVYFLCNSQNCTLFVAVENPMGRSILGRQHCYASYSGVFVKGMTQLLVTDELHVMPPSTKASLSFTFRCMSHGCVHYWGGQS